MSTKFLIYLKPSGLMKIMQPAFNFVNILFYVFVFCIVCCASFCLVILSRKVVSLFVTEAESNIQQLEPNRNGVAKSVQMKPKPIKNPKIDANHKPAAGHDANKIKKKRRTRCKDNANSGTEYSDHASGYDESDEGWIPVEAKVRLRKNRKDNREMAKIITPRKLSSQSPLSRRKLGRRQSGNRRNPLLQTSGSMPFVEPPNDATYKEVTIDHGCHELEHWGCKMQIPAGAVASVQQIQLRHWQRHEKLPDGSFAVTPTIQCTPCGLFFNSPIQITLPISYHPELEPARIRVEESLDHLTWHSLKTMQVTRDQRSLQFESHHFSRFRGVSIPNKTMVSTVYLRRSWTDHNPSQYILIWCIHDDTGTLSSRVKTDMENCDCYCNDCIIYSELFSAPHNSIVTLKILSGGLVVLPQNISLDISSNQVYRKPQFYLEKTSIMSSFSLEYVAQVDNMDVLKGSIILQWDKKLQRSMSNSSSGVFINELKMTVGNQSTGITVNPESPSVDPSSPPKFSISDR